VRCQWKIGSKRTVNIVVLVIDLNKFAIPECVYDYHDISVQIYGKFIRILPSCASLDDKKIVLESRVIQTHPHIPITI